MEINSKFCLADFGDWDPITSTVNLEDVPSIANCFSFSCGPSDPETMLVPYVIRQYPLDTIVWSIENIWDPLSSSQTQRLANMLGGDLFRALPWSINGDPRFEKILKAVDERLARTIAEDVYIPLLPSSHVLDLKSDSGQFFLRQWNTGK